MNLITRKYTFIKNSMLKHRFKYDYHKVKYANMHSDVIITCPNHGDFTQSPKNHISGSECPVCAYRYTRYGKNLYRTPKIIAYDICRYRCKYA